MKQAPHRIHSANALADWLADAAPGACAIYHEGHLAWDRSSENKTLPEEERYELGTLAGVAWRCHERGVVHLVQRRIGPEKWAYLAIARQRTAFHQRRARAPSTTDAAQALACPGSAT